jgi:hypothetical protein
MTDSLSWTTALTSGLASAVGAWLGAHFAFRFNQRIETEKKQRVDVEAGHVVLAIMLGKILDIRQYAAGWESTSQRTDAPCWHRFKSPRLIPEDSHRVDVGSLGFLLSRGQAAVVSDVRYAETTYYDIVGVLRDYKAVYEEKLIPAMHAVGVPETLTAAEAMRFDAQLPRAVTLQIEDLYKQLDVRLTIGHDFMLRAASNLRNALSAAFPKVNFQSAEPKGRIAVITPEPPARRSGV